MSTETAFILGTALGAFITGTVSIVNYYIKKRFESKQKRKESLIKAGLDYWTTLINAPGGGVVGPPEQYMAHMSNLLDVILDDTFDKDKFKKTLIENHEFQVECTELILNLDRKRREEPAQSKKKPASSTLSNSESDESGSDPLLKRPKSPE